MQDFKLHVNIDCCIDKMLLQDTLRATSFVSTGSVSTRNMNTNVFLSRCVSLKQSRTSVNSTPLSRCSLWFKIKTTPKPRRFQLCKGAFFTAFFIYTVHTGDQEKHWWMWWISCRCFSGLKIQLLPVKGKCVWWRKFFKASLLKLEKIYQLPFSGQDVALGLSEQHLACMTQCINIDSHRKNSPVTEWPVDGPERMELFKSGPAWMKINLSLDQRVVVLTGLSLLQACIEYTAHSSPSGLSQHTDGYLCSHFILNIRWTLYGYAEGP